MPSTTARMRRRTRPSRRLGCKSISIVGDRSKARCRRQSVIPSRRICFTTRITESTLVLTKELHESHSKLMQRLHLFFSPLTIECNEELPVNTSTLDKVAFMCTTPHSLFFWCSWHRDDCQRPNSWRWTDSNYPSTHASADHDSRGGFTLHSTLTHARCVQIWHPTRRWVARICHRHHVRPRS
jgi:hypothetical protein